MIPKPESCRLNDTAWERLTFWKRLDIWVSSWMPMWVIILLIAIVFGMLFGGVISGVIAFAAWDISWMWGITARALYAGWSVVFWLILIAQR